MSDIWYYADENGPVGPFTLEELKETLRTFPKAKASDVFVWRDGFPDWKPVEDVVELKGQTPVPPPLPSSETRNGDKARPAESPSPGRLALDAHMHEVQNLLTSPHLKPVFQICIFVALVWFFTPDQIIQAFFGRSGNITPTVATTNNKTRSAALTEVVKTTAQELFNVYEYNEVATDNALKGKIIEITGVIEAIDKNVFDHVFVSLETKHEFMPARIQVSSQEEMKIAALHRGQMAVFRCPKIKRWVRAPLGEDCILMSVD